MDYCNFFFTLTLLGNRWVPWFLLGTWLFYAHSRGLLGLVSLREMKDYSYAKSVGLPVSFLTQNTALNRLDFQPFEEIRFASISQQPGFTYRLVNEPKILRAF